MGGNRRRVQWGEIARFVGPSLRPSRRPKLAGVLSTDDLIALAKRRVPRAVFDYADGSAEREIGSQRAMDAFRRVEFRPHVLRDVSTVDTSTTILGRPVPFPVVLGPTGFTRMLHTAGESAVASAAARAGVPYTLSTMATTSIEALPADGNRWFQLYLWKDRPRSIALLDRARAAGYSTLVLTVDVPVAGARRRDSRNGLTIPPTLSFRTMRNMARKPRWLFDALTTDPLAFETLGSASDIQTMGTMFEPAVTPADVSWIKEKWGGSIVVKGIQRVDDAKTAVAAGADGIAVSCHGGRQLDRSITPLELLPDVVDAVDGSAEVYLDGGVRSGADVAAAVALGATAAFIARPYLYALMAAGEPGVDRLMQLLLADYTRTLQLLGVTATAELDRELVRLLPR